MYLALLTDLDGTVIKTGSNGDDIDVLTRSAVQRAQNIGIKISCATGRGWRSTGPVAKQLGLVDPCIIEGGARIIDPSTGNTLWEKSLNEENSNEVLKILKTIATGTEYLKRVTDAVKIPLLEVDEIAQENRIIYLLDVEKETAQAIVNSINTTSYAVAHTAQAWGSNGLLDIHITHPEATKSHAATIWRKMVGVSKEQVIGMGDDMNDIPMFDSVGWRVAVANAPEALKKHADYIAPSKEAGALRHVIQKYFL